MTEKNIETDEQPEGLGKQLKRGVFWQYFQTGFNTVFKFGTGVVLARLLDPSDFGLFAAVTSITNLLLMQINFGWTSALLRAKQLDKMLLSTVFWFMQAIAILLMGAVVIFVPYFTAFYQDDRFGPVMLLVCLQFFIVPFNIINGGILRWKMRYDLVSRIAMAVSIISSVTGISLAYFGFGVYSLVVTGLLSSILVTIIMAFYAPWKPMFLFSLDAVKPHFDFTWRLHLNNSLNLLAGRIDNLMVGKLVGLSSLGIYVKAFSLGRMPVDLLARNLYQMFFTALSRVRESQSGSLVMFQKMIGALTFSIYLPLLLLLFLGEGFIFHLYGEKWLGAVLPMRIMIIGSFVIVITMTSGAFCAAQNLVRKETKVQFLNLIMTITAVLIGSKWGLPGISIGIVIKAFIMLYLMKKVLEKGIGLKWRDLWKPVWPNVCAALIASLLVLLLVYGFNLSGAETNIVRMASIAFTICSGYLITWFFLALSLKSHPEMVPILDLAQTAVTKMSGKIQ